MSRAKKKFEHRSFFRVLVILFACTEASGLAMGAPARFWFSLDPNDPYRFSTSASSGNSLPDVPTVELVPGATEKLYLWARARTSVPPNPVPDNLLNFSLNIVVPQTSPNLVNFESVKIDNPQVIDDPLNENNRDRFDFEIDSNNELTVVTEVTRVGDEIVIVDSTTFPRNPPMLPQAVPPAIAGIERFAAFTLSQFVPEIGIGDACVATEVPCVAVGSDLAWRLAELEVSVDPATLPASTEAWLQVGSLGITHANESGAITMVTFGDPSSQYIYNTTTQRDVTLSGDPSDIKFNVVDRWSADYDRNLNGSTVSGSDFLVWQRDKSGSPFPPGTSGDGNNDNLVNGVDLDIWRWQYGKTVAPTSGFSAPLAVPEPSTCLLATMAACIALWRNAGRYRRFTLALALLCCSATPGTTQAAQLNADWLGGAGLWAEAPLWSTTNFPNNGADTYAVMISTGPSTVLLNTDVTIDNLTMTSPNAGLGISATLNVEEFVQILSGGISVSGTIMGGTLENFGGSLSFNNGTLNGTTLFGDLDLTDGQNYVRLTSGASFTGNALLGGVESQLTYDGNFTVDGPLILLTGTVSNLALAEDTQLTLGPATTVALNGPTAMISGTGFHSLINQGTVTSSGAGSHSISLHTLSNQGTIRVDDGTMSVSGSSSFANTGVLHVALGATLDVNSNLSHTSDGQLIGLGTVEIGTFTNSAAVRPGGSTPGSVGTLTIDGGYTQTANGVLEIDIYGPNPQDHDKLNVLDSVEVEGGLVLAIDPLYVPIAGQTMEVLAGGDYEGSFGTTRVNNLPSQVAYQIVYKSSGIDIQFVAPTDTDLNMIGGAPVPWSNSMTWSGAVPDSTARVVLSDNGGLAGTVRVLPPEGGPINAAHSVEVGGGADQIQLSVEGTSLSVSTATTISNSGTVALSNGSTLLSQSVTVAGGGRLSGTGKVVGNIEVGAGGGVAATFDPVGNFIIEGDFTQGSNGLFAIEIAGVPASGNNDTVSVSGGVTLSGVLEIDLTNLTDVISPSDGFTVLSSLGPILGEFDDIAVKGGKGKYGRSKKKQGGGEDPTVQAFLYDMGDIDGNETIDSFDAEVFAHTLINPQILYYKKGNTELFDGFIDAFNFNSGQDSPDIDFHDIEGFVDAMSNSGGISAQEAYNQVEAAIAAALEGNLVPEPSGIVLSLTMALFVQGFRRSY